MKKGIPSGEDFVPYEIVTIELDIPLGLVAIQPKEVYDAILETNVVEEKYEVCAELVKMRERYEEYCKNPKI